MPSIEELLRKSIPELRELFLERGRAVPKGLLEALEVDTRQGAHYLAKRIRERYRSNRSEGQRLHTLLRFEIDLWAQGYSLVAGVDEAGMAPLAGPVVAGAVILPQNYKLRGLNDSKKILDHEMRDELAAQIKQDAICWSYGFAEVEEIDRINIYHAGLLAMQRALHGLSRLPDFVLVDARKIPQCPAPQRGIIRGAQGVGRTTNSSAQFRQGSTSPGPRPNSDRAFRRCFGRISGRSSCGTSSLKRNPFAIVKESPQALIRLHGFPDRVQEEASLQQDSRAWAGKEADQEWSHFRYPKTPGHCTPLRLSARGRWSLKVVGSPQGTFA